LETFGVWGETKFSLSSQSSIDLVVFYFFDCCSCLLFSSTKPRRFWKPSGLGVKRGIRKPRRFWKPSGFGVKRGIRKPRRFWKPSGFGVKGILLYFHILFLQYSQYPFILNNFSASLNPEGFKNLRGLFKELNIFTNRINIL
jgi:hypothetical protein